MLGKEEKLDNIISKENDNSDKIKANRPIYGRFAGPINTGDEEIEKVRRLYEMSVYLLKNGYSVNSLGKREIEIKTGISNTIKTGIYKIALTYTPSDPEFNTIPKFEISLFNLYQDSRHNPKKVLNLKLYSFNPNSLKQGLTTNIVVYEPGKWEEVLEKKYKEKVEEDKLRNFPIKYKGQDVYKDIYPDFYVLEGDKELKS